MTSLVTKIENKLIRAGRRGGIIGTVGRWYGTHRGISLPAGPRIIIDRPGEYIQASILRRGYYEPQIVDLFTYLVRPGAFFIDVGANIGQYTLVAAQYCNVVHAFEPVPRLATRLRENLILNRFTDRVEVHCAALSNEEGRAVLHVAGRRDDGSHSLISGVEASSIDLMYVPTTTIDNHVAKFGRAPDLVKIDVEGAEALVLDGARDTISSPAPPVILLETGDRLAERIGESTRSVLHRLFTKQYRLFRLDENMPEVREVEPDACEGGLANYAAIPSGSSLMNHLVERCRRSRHARS